MLQHQNQFFFRMNSGISGIIFYKYFEIRKSGPDKPKMYRRNIAKNICNRSISTFQKTVVNVF